VRKKNHGKTRNPTVTVRPWDSPQQLLPSHEVRQDESNSNQIPDCIPAIVNGQINPKLSIIVKVRTINGISFTIY
jgi:hypothetical protein